ncbi:MAG: hypothetical protein KatS3mg042_1124 [Rhodothermaceae bacterium]|nr:MAG: hypothetical protein KatS3mg042_1124 [Rhodothermaceae bacterium]
MTPTLDDVLARLREEGLYEADAAPSLDEGPAARADPWYVRTLLVVGAWMAGVLFVLFLSATSWLREAGPSLATGLVLVAGALGLRPRLRGLFLEQLAFALSLAGQFMVASGLGRLVGWEASTWAALGLLEALLVLLYPDALHRLVSTGLAVGALTLAIAELGMPGLVQLLLLGCATGMVGLWEAEHRMIVAGLADRTRPVARGLAVSLAGLLLLPVTDAPPFASLPWWPVTLGLAGLLAVVAVRLLRDLDVPAWTRTPGLVLLMVLVVVVLLTRDTPGIVGALLLLALGFRHGRPVVMGLAVAFLAVFLSIFYYQMSRTLLEKAFLLSATGGVLLVLRWAFRRFTGLPPGTP